MTTSPSIMIYDLGKDTTGRGLTLKRMRGFPGPESFSLHRDEGADRDPPQTVAGLSLDNMKALVDFATLFMEASIR